MTTMVTQLVSGWIKRTSWVSWKMSSAPHQLHLEVPLYWLYSLSSGNFSTPVQPNSPVSSELKIVQLPDNCLPTLSPREWRVGWKWALEHHNRLQWVKFTSPGFWRPQEQSVTWLSFQYKADSQGRAGPATEWEMRLRKKWENIQKEGTNTNIFCHHSTGISSILRQLCFSQMAKKENLINKVTLKCLYMRQYSLMTKSTNSGISQLFMPKLELLLVV